MNQFNFQQSSGTTMDKKVKGMTVFNTNEVDTKKQPMFFGAPLGVQRYDSFKYPQFENLTKQQLGYFWRPEEVSFCLLYTSPSPRDRQKSRMPSSA